MCCGFVLLFSFFAPQYIAIKEYCGLIIIIIILKTMINYYLFLIIKIKSI